MVKVAIVHEGNSKKTHDNSLLRLLIEHLNLDIHRVKFFAMGKKSSFFEPEHQNYKELHLDIKLENIAKILFVIDADYEKNDQKYNGTKNTLFELSNFLKEIDLEPYSDIHVMCEPKTQSGYLESLLLSTIPDKEKMCIENFLECSNFKDKEHDKAILHNIYNLAYPNAPFDLKHDHFTPLKHKLLSLFEMP